ncbi:MULTISPECIES: hypothetical protein [unclassified Oceanobacter]|jgi:hypothetical protein|uniref:hypothetical protein n=1 Tax=unclassified Oceanobacter TaxID=2620260 RepID=UPI0027357D27|nr:MULTISPECIES: hypothetical protein [unclassified Oceanobacter]MDP2505585.1 hypothetical protein [Oceanobacter sp. 3_MG-2023]MDP2547167.1 hypothetical protein [Oceanobacter sp. 4_MG-2023]
MADNIFEIDIEAFGQARQSGQPINGKDGQLTFLIKQVIECYIGSMIPDINAGGLRGVR